MRSMLQMIDAFDTLIHDNIAAYAKATELCHCRLPQIQTTFLQYCTIISIYDGAPLNLQLECGQRALG